MCIRDRSASCFEEGTTESWTQEQITTALALPAVMGLIFYDEVHDPVGFFLGRVIHDEAEILLIGVIPSKRRQGLGGEILSAVIEILRDRGADQIFLDVRDGNEPAINLYQKYHFEICGCRKNYYRMKDGSRVDALLLSRRNL